MSMSSIDVELKRVARLTRTCATRINNEANANGALYSGIPIAKKVEEISQILEDELAKVINDFMNKSNIEKVEKFIDGQKNYMYKSAYALGLPESSLIHDLDTRAEELKGLVQNKRNQSKRARREKLITFWVPVTISIIALIVSIVSLVGSHSK